MPATVKNKPGKQNARNERDLRANPITFHEHPEVRALNQKVQRLREHKAQLEAQVREARQRDSEFDRAYADAIAKGQTPPDPPDIAHVSRKIESVDRMIANAEDEFRAQHKRRVLAEITSQLADEYTTVARQLREAKETMLEAGRAVRDLRNKADSLGVEIGGAPLEPIETVDIDKLERDIQHLSDKKVKERLSRGQAQERFASLQNKINEQTRNESEDQT